MFKFTERVGNVERVYEGSLGDIVRFVGAMSRRGCGREGEHPAKTISIRGKLDEIYVSRDEMEEVAKRAVAESLRRSSYTSRP